MTTYVCSVVYYSGPWQHRTRCMRQGWYFFESDGEPNGPYDSMESAHKARERYNAWEAAIFDPYPVTSRARRFDNIDETISRYEPAHGVPGTIIQRVLLQVSLAKQHGLQVPEDKRDNDSILVWTIGIGHLLEPKHFVYGLTIWECVTRLDSQVELGEVEFDPQIFPLLGRGNG